MNTGLKIYRWLKEIDVNTGLPTGARKPNIPSDSDYIAPIIDQQNCPIDRKFFGLKWSDQDAPTNTFNNRSYIFDNSLNTNVKKRDETYDFSIEVDKSNITNIIQFYLYVSEDQGKTWQLLSSDLNQPIIDNITINSTHKQYKGEIILKDNTTVYSNILQITRNHIGIGQIVLVHNNIEYNSLNHNVDINLISDSTLLFKNKSIDQIVQLADIKVSKDTGLAVVITDNEGYVVNQTIYEVQPQINEWIQPNNGWKPLVIKELKAGNYVLRLAVVDPNNKTTKVYMYNWYITVK